MRGYIHVYSTQDGGINPVQLSSEFAGRKFYHKNRNDISDFLETIVNTFKNAYDISLRKEYFILKKSNKD